MARQGVGPSSRLPADLPRDFLDEIETELRYARGSLAENRERVEALEELRSLAAMLAGAMGRPITVFDLVRSARDRAELERRTRLVHRLRVSSR